MQRQPNFWTRREDALATLIGREAAWLMNACLAWTLGALACWVPTTPLALFAYVDSSGDGYALILGLFLLGCGCAIRAVTLNGRGARLAEAYVTTEVGHPVRIGSAKLTVAWWRKRIEREHR
jgi:hypothetical protein